MPLHAQGPPYCYAGPRLQVKFLHVIRCWAPTQKDVRAFFASIRKAVLLCLSYAFIQLSSVCASLELHAPRSRVSTAVYVSTIYKSLFGSPSADLVFEAQGHQQTPLQAHALLRSFWIFRYQLLPWRKAESVSVLHTSVLSEIWSFSQFFWSYQDFKI